MERGPGGEPRPTRGAQARGSRPQRCRARALPGDKAAPARPDCSGRCWASTRADPGPGEDCCHLRLARVVKKPPASSPASQLLSSLLQCPEPAREVDVARLLTVPCPAELTQSASRRLAGWLASMTIENICSHPQRCCVATGCLDLDLPLKTAAGCADMSCF